MRVAVRFSAASAHEAFARRRGCAVIVDVLRATTTLTVARAHGALRVVAADTPERALALRAAHHGALVCGERDGRIVPGFDLGNSPSEYVVERVRGRTLIFASTNGSLAMLAAAKARRRIAAAFVNAGAVVDALGEEKDVTIVCAGKLGRFSLEDAALAGMLCERLAARGARIEGGEARMARAIAPKEGAEVRALLEGCSHGRYLRKLGGAFADDVEFCGRLDTIGSAYEV
jgi:2-phosphosulfolactate phosphatase